MLIGHLQLLESSYHFIYIIIPLKNSLASLLAAMSIISVASREILMLLLLIVVITWTNAALFISPSYSLATSTYGMMMLMYWIIVSSVDECLDECVTR